MKKGSLSSHLLALIIIAVTEYIAFSLDTGAFVALIGVPVICAVMCTAATVRVAVLLGVFQLLVAVLAASFGAYMADMASMLKFAVTFLQLHLPAYTLAFCAVNYKSELKQSVVAASGANILVTVADLAVIKYFHKINISDFINSSFDTFADAYMNAIANTELSAMLDAATLTNVLKLVKTALMMFMPAILILICVVMSFITFKIACVLVKNFTSVHVSPMSKLRYFSMDSKLSFFTFALIIISFMSSGSYFAGGVYNFALLSAFAYGVNGLAVVDFMVAKRIKGDFAHKMIMLFIVLVSLISGAFISAFSGAGILFFLGLLDTSFDFRKLHRLK